MMKTSQAIVRRAAQWAVLVLLAMWSTGCATNPVTKRREFRIVSESQEVRIGQSNYSAYQQAQGGAYTAEPTVSAYVGKVGEKLWSVSDRPNLPYEIVVLNSDVPNAWAIPGGKMAVNRGLLTELKSEAELAAVLSHEIVHVAAGHGANSMERGMFAQGVLMGIGLWAKDNDAADLIVGGSGLAAGMVMMKYSRGDELEADRYGIDYMVRAGYDPKAAVTLQETFLRLSEGKDGNWLTGLLSTHPPSRERVEKNREHAAKYPTGGYMGREEYAKAMEPLVQTKPAYEEARKGYAALQAGDPARAQKLAQNAIAKQPREAQFHALAAKAYASQRDFGNARQSMDRAVALDNRNFEYYLTRGQLFYEMGKPAAARADLEKSTALLPTATGHYLLGAVARDSGNPDAAIQHFRTAASSPSSDGQKAAVLLARMDLSEHPARYLKIQPSLNSRGFITLTVENTTPVDVKTCVMGVYSPTTRRWESYRFPQGLPARRSMQIQTRVGPFPNAEAARTSGADVRFDQVAVE